MNFRFPGYKKPFIRFSTKQNSQDWQFFHIQGFMKLDPKTQGLLCVNEFSKKSLICINIINTVLIPLRYDSILLYVHETRKIKNFMPIKRLFSQNFSDPYGDIEIKPYQKLVISAIWYRKFRTKRRSKIQPRLSFYWRLVYHKLYIILYYTSMIWLPKINIYR